MAASSFAASTIHEDPATRLTSLAAWSDEVAVGTQEGLLLHLAPEKGSDKPTLRNRVRASSDQAIVQLCAAEKCGVLVLLLGDGTVTTHELPSLKSRGPVERGVDCASITLLRANEADGCRLAAAGRKKLVLYKWRAGTSAESGLFEAEEGCFEPFSEVGLPEPMRWMAWGGEKQLWLALKQRYVKLSVGSLEMADVLPFTGGMGGGGGGAGGGKDKKEKEKAGDASGGGGEPLGEPLSGGEALLLAQETLGVFVDAGGKPCRGFSIAFAEPPVALAATGPLFLVALHKKGADVHALHGARAPLQRVAHLAGAIAVAVASGVPKPPALRPPPVYVLCTHSVERLLPPTLPAHAVALAASGGADEALTLSEHHITPVLWAAGEHDATLMHLAKLANAQQQSDASAAPPKEQLAVFAPPGAAKAASSDPPPSDKDKGPKHKRSGSAGASGSDAGAQAAAQASAAEAEAAALASLVAAERAEQFTMTLVGYLRKLNTTTPSEVSVLKRHADTLLRREPTVAAALLCERIESTGTWLLPPSDVLSLLREAAPNATLPTLECLLADATDAERPNAIAALVRGLMLSVTSTGGNAAFSGPTKGAQSTARDARDASSRLQIVLKEAVENNELDVKGTLQTIEAASQRDVWPLARHRLLLLGSLGRHADAIELLTTKLDSVTLAFEYCTTHTTSSSSTDGTSPNLFGLLLDRYLKPTGGGPPLLSAANELLARWPESESAIDALRKLPPSLPISSLESGLSALLRGAQERQRVAQMRSALLRAVSLQTRAELQQKRGKRIVVGDESTCFICGRRIGNAAFCSVGEKGLAHLACVQQSVSLD